MRGIVAWGADPLPAVLISCALNKPGRTFAQLKIMLLKKKGGILLLFFEQIWLLLAEVRPSQRGVWSAKAAKDLAWWV